MPTPSVARSRSPAASSALCLPSPVEGAGQIINDAFPSSSSSTISPSDEAGPGVESNVTSGVTAKTSVQDSQTHNDHAPIISSASLRVVVPADVSSTDASNVAARNSANADVAPSRETTASPPQPDVQAQSHSQPRTDASTSSSQGHTLRADDTSPLSQAEWEVTGPRIRPSITSSLFRPGSRFVGAQRSDKATYTVSVELKQVDMAQSFCCGFLTIQGTLLYDSLYSSDSVCGL